MKSLIIYELNEVPWDIIDYYVERRPTSTIAQLVRTGRCLTTVNEDSEHLSPWRTWPTMHKSLYTRDHNSWDLGQDPATFRGKAIWDVLDEAKISAGIFGALQSWPPRAVNGDGFHIPDTFAQDASTAPRSLSAFQDFNLRMTAENSYSSNSPLRVGNLVTSGAKMLTLGVTASSAIQIGRHLAREMRDERYKAARAMFQALPSFDLYWRLHRKARPRLSIFFTNHVAAMMHRFWGDAVPGYTDSNDYQIDSIFSSFLLSSLDIADSQLRKIKNWTDRQPDAVMTVASSMGQGPIPYQSVDGSLLFLEDGNRLSQALGFPSGEARLAMHPMCALAFGSTADAGQAAALLAEVVDPDGNAVFEDFDVSGHSVSFRTSYRPVPDDLRVLFRRRDSDKVYESSLDEVGLVAKARLGGGNTAYHIPEGIVVTYGADIASDGSRKTVSALDFAPSLLRDIYGLEAPETMAGIHDATFYAPSVA